MLKPRQNSRPLSGAARHGGPESPGSLRRAVQKAHGGEHTNAEDKARQPSIKVVMMPRDTNPLGTIFGGIILSYIDQAGVVEAQNITSRKLATVAMHEVKFLAPVFVGDVVSFYSEIARVGRTSITVCVTVDARRGKPPHEIVRVTQAEVVYVAVDTPGKAVPVVEGVQLEKASRKRVPK